MANFNIPQDFDPVEKNMKKWPVYLQASQRAEFIQDLNRKTYNEIVGRKDLNLEELINKCVQNEIRRVRSNPWKVDPPNELLFWKKVQKDLSAATKYTSGIGEERQKEILRKIVNRYSQEIVGNFKIGAFKFARIFTHTMFSVIFNRAFKNFLPRNYFSSKKLKENIRLYGYVEEVRKMYDKDCIIAVIPTHMSNLDSPLIGYILEFRAGLPAFNYGAGLNLFNSEIAAYFMNRLGAYRIDRRKKNKIYLETLTSYSELAVYNGVNSLFFTGGTRSRSGRIEQNLKLGLLSTLLDAQRELLKNGERKKIIVVPMTLSYHFVFEANSLIHQHLRVTGKERYIRSRNQAMSFLDYFKLGYKLKTKQNEVVSCFAEPIDVLGNMVDIEGNSLDQYGNSIDISEYFMSEGEIVEDPQRESVYTTALSEKLSKSYYKYNIVLSSHALAYFIFEYWMYHEGEDVFTFLRTPLSELYFPQEKLISKFEIFISELKKKESAQQLILSEIFNNDSGAIIKDALDYLGVYHRDIVLKWHKKKNVIITENLELLYYYHNRLRGFELEDNKEAWIK